MFIVCTFYGSHGVCNSISGHARLDCNQHWRWVGFSTISGPFQDFNQVKNHWFFLGDTRLGLFRTCVTLHGHKMVCQPASLPTEWTVALVLIFIGIFCLLSTLAVTLLPPSFTRGLKKSAKWLGFSTGIFFYVVTACGNYWPMYASSHSFLFSGCLLSGCCYISHGLHNERNRRSSIPTAQ